MQKDSKGFISDLFGTESPNEDVRQTLLYNYVKAYPSVNSSNSGSVHSEENVRWLTKQFTKKPFIIPYDNNNMDEFAYSGADLNAGTANGGMVNIDGYIINTASNMTQLSFDNTENTLIGTGTYGYIGHQTLQRYLQYFMSGISTGEPPQQITQREELPFPDASEIHFISEYFEELQTKYPGMTEDQCWNYISTCFSNIYKRKIFEQTEDNYSIQIGSVNYVIPIDYSISTNSGFDNTKETSSGLYGSVKITYENEEVVNYIKQMIPDFENPPVNCYIVETETGIQVDYPVFFGIPSGTIKPKFNEELSIYMSVLFIKDIFEFCYIYNTDLTFGTNTYPSTLYTDINFMEDAVTPRDLTQPLSIIYANPYIYDMGQQYEPINIESADIYEDLKREILLSPEFTDIDFYSRENSRNLLDLRLSVESVLSNHFSVVSDSTIMNTYEVYNNVDDIEVQNQLNQGKDLASLCDNYYCLKLPSEILNIFGISKGNNDYIPIGFMTSSGAAMIRNYEKIFNQTAHEDNPNWSYQSSYIDPTTNETIYQQIYVEGYLSFFRRVCSKLYSIDISDIQGPYGNISNLNETNNSGWNEIFKDIQFGDLVINIDSSIQPYVSVIKTFFDVVNIEDITFGILYNKLLAPYVNFYTQLGWSQLLDNTLTANNNKYKAIRAYTELKKIINSDLNIVDNLDSMDIPIEHKYSNDYVGHKTLKYYLNTYTDYERINNFLCDGVWKVSNPTIPASFRTRVESSNLNFQICQDYIDYMKSCTDFQWESPQERNNGYVQIPFKITTLENDNSNSYDGFKTIDGVVDRFANYSYWKKENDTWEKTICTLQPGYIQNVKISTSTLLPISRLYIDNEYVLYKTIPPIDNNPQNERNPFDQIDYTIKLSHHITQDFDGAIINGVSGYNFIGKTQGWVVTVPTLFRLYKDSQNDLNGRYRGTANHAGIYIDYKFPKDIEETDFWFANTLLGSVRSMVDYDIESSKSEYPDQFYISTKDTLDYLKWKNKTLFYIDSIYGKDTDGNYLHMDNYIQKYLSNKLDDKPTETYVDWENVVNEDPKCSTVEYKGLQNNITRLKKYVDDNMSYFVNYTPSLLHDITHEDRLEFLTNIVNNRYQSIVDINGVNPMVFEDGNIMRICPQDLSDIPTNELNSHTVDPLLNTKNTNSIFHSVIRVKFRKCVTLCLDTIFNYFNSESPGLPTTWNSNYPMISKLTTEENPHIYWDITLENLISPQEVSEALIELTVNPVLYSSGQSGTNHTTGYCNISMLSSEHTLTQMDMNYLWKELYKLDNISWKQVSTITRSGCAQKLWRIGDTKTFDVTYDGNTYAIQAMIIGFDQDVDRCYPQSSHTITWMTNIYNNAELNVENVTLFNHKFPALLYTTTGQSRYNHVTDNNYDLSVVNWLNYDKQDAEAQGIGVYAYCDPEFLSVLAKSVTTNSLVFTCSDANNYKLATSVDTHTSEMGEPLTFWLPSLSQLGLSFRQDDVIENTLNEEGVATRINDWHGENYNGVSYNIPECGLNNDPMDLAYSYFKQDKSIQNVKVVTMLTSSYYTINLDLTTLPTPTTVEDYQFDRTDYDGISYNMYAVGAGYDSNDTSGRWFTILHKEDIPTILNNRIYTDFCFISI